MDDALTKIVNFIKGDVIVAKGDNDSGIYYIKNGVAENLESGILYGNTKECSHQFFGLIGSINCQRTSTIVARSDVEALVIDFSIIKDNESIHTIVFELMKESVEIIIGLEKKNADLLKEIQYLKQR